MDNFVVHLMDFHMKQDIVVEKLKNNTVVFVLSKFHYALSEYVQEESLAFLELMKSFSIQIESKCFK